MSAQRKPEETLNSLAEYRDHEVHNQQDSRRLGWPMKLDLREESGVGILVLSGQLTSDSDRQFREAIDTLIESGRTNILLDFTELNYMDSSGIGELVASYRTIQRLGGALKILKPSKRIQDSLKLTQLLPIFEIFEDAETAIASYGPAIDPR